MRKRAVKLMNKSDAYYYKFKKSQITICSRKQLLKF